MSRASPIIADLHLAQMPAKIKAFSDLKACVEDSKAGRSDTSAFALVDTRSLEAEIEILRAKAELVDAKMKADLVETTMKAGLVKTTMKAELGDAESEVKVEQLPEGLLAMPVDDLKSPVGDSNVCANASSRGTFLKEENDSVNAEDGSVKAEDDSAKAEEHTSSRLDAPVRQEEK